MKIASKSSLAFLNVRSRKVSVITGTVFSILTCLQFLPISAYAESTNSFQMEAPDSAPAADSPPAADSALASNSAVPGGASQASAATTKTLIGGVKKHQAYEDGRSPLFQLAVRKLQDKIPLSAEEFRSLGVGTAGYESDRTFFQPIGKISVVYADSPADKAGLKRGDKIYDDSKDEEAKADPSQPLQKVTFGHEGTTVEVTVLRHRQKVVYTLARMNIEDIREPEIRHLWEQMITDLGHPDAGSFIGKTFKTMKPVATNTGF